MKENSRVTVSEIVCIKMVIKQVSLDMKKIVRRVLRKSDTGNGLRFR